MRTLPGQKRASKGHTRGTSGATPALFPSSQVDALIMYEDTVPCIPPELTDKVIDFVAEEEDAKLVLKNCSLACRAWLPRSRHHLFRCFTVKERWGFSKFLDFLEYYPELSVNIQTLELHEGGFGYMDNDPWMNYDVAAIPNSVTSHIRSLHLENMHWGLLSSDAREFFTTQFPAVESFSIARTAVSLSFLTVRDIGWEEYPDKFALENTQRHHGLHIDSLLLVDHALFPWILEGHLAPGVRTLEIRQNDIGDIEVIGRILQHIGPSLEELNIHFPFTHLGSSLHPTVVDSKSANLEVLTLAQSDADTFDYLSWINRFLSKVRSQIRRVHITMKGVPARPPLGYWLCINATLGTEMFKNLEEVVVTINRSLIGPQEAAEVYTRYLSIPKQRGLLRIEYMST
ncbi:hypothetical protein A0H81_06688 [Grifola frondosa]|uniref:F-box domain-containing protein n=1 Tax=Grifola frondosa TaxID=5627 RepID=A0A1C7M7E2_GRIFR|nr:hypothetical protein A0H81_06688 [Grifola frondosa]